MKSGKILSRILPPKQSFCGGRVGLIRRPGRTQNTRRRRARRVPARMAGMNKTQAYHPIDMARLSESRDGVRGCRYSPRATAVFRIIVASSRFPVGRPKFGVTTPPQRHGGHRERESFRSLKIFVSLFSYLSVLCASVVNTFEFGLVLTDNRQLGTNKNGC